tara:strand:- start:458 stop:763 length:306 start_codon:yes stop_codon:yes gene_type:complete
MKCNECNRTRHKNYYNEIEFDMDLFNHELIGGNEYPHKLKFGVRHFFGSTTEGFKHDSTFSLILDDGMGDTEMHLCEDGSLSQLKRLYNFLDYIFNKEEVK